MVRFGKRAPAMVRFGRSAEDLSEEDDGSAEDELMDNMQTVFVRPVRALRMIRVGRQPAMVRFGKRGGAPAMVRFGKRAPAMVRFGRSPAMVRFGRSPAMVRFGKRAPAMVRFG